MNKVKFFVNDNNALTGFTVSGHSGFAESGKDIVCAAISSAVIMTANTITEVLKLSADVAEDDGYVSVKFTDSSYEQAQDLLRGLELHLTQLSKIYPSNISIEYGGNCNA
jgi:uncharacterized protein YsxB (DUF464 family)